MEYFILTLLVYPFSRYQSLGAQFANCISHHCQLIFANPIEIEGGTQLDQF